MRPVARVLGVLLLLALAAAVSSAPPARAQETVTMPFADPVGATVDGVVGPSEYPASLTDPETGIGLYLVHDGRNMTVGMVSPGTGWVAVGFGAPGVIMDGANILIGYVSGATTVLSDEIGVGFGHSADTTLGGTDDIIERAGTESGGRTTIEFRFPLDSGDARDVRLQEGQAYGMILAFEADADDLVTRHTAAALASLTVGRDPNAMPTRIATLRLGSAGGEVEGGNVTLVGTLLGDDGAPLVGAPVSVYLNSSVGLGLIGTVQTDAYGVANVTYPLRSPGEFRFYARFDGYGEYLPAEANLTLVAQRAGETVPLLTADLAIRLLIGAVLGGVAIAYGFAIFQILGIRKAGRRTGRAAVRSAPRRGGTS